MLRFTVRGFIGARWPLVSDSLSPVTARSFIRTTRAFTDWPPAASTPCPPLPPSIPALAVICTTRFRHRARNHRLCGSLPLVQHCRSRLAACGDSSCVLLRRLRRWSGGSGDGGEGRGVGIEEWRRRRRFALSVPGCGAPLRPICVCQRVGV